MKKKLIIFGVVLLLLIIAGGAAYFFILSKDEGAIKPLIVSPKTGSALISDDTYEPTTIKLKEPEPEPEPEPNPKIVSKPIKPSFDVIRVTPEGDVVMAGKSEPFAKITIYYNGKQNSKLDANEDGDWVFTSDAKLKAGDYEASLEAINKDKKVYKSERVEIISVPEQKNEDVLVVQTDARGGDTKIRQKPDTDKTIEKEIKIAIDVVDYDENGINGITGIASSNSQLRLYKNNEFVTDGKANKDGKWRINQKIATQGNVKLRVDSVDNSGKVLSRAETDVNIKAIGENIPFGSIVMVEKGSNLWTIARRIYGSGFAYMIIFAANFDQIQNPDLIYPGQLFVLPPKNN